MDALGWLLGVLKEVKLQKKINFFLGSYLINLVIMYYITYIQDYLF